MHLQRERAEAAAGRGAPGPRTGAAPLAGLSWIIPQRPVYLPPEATAALAAVPAAMIIYLLWTLRTGRNAKGTSPSPPSHLDLWGYF